MEKKIFISADIEGVSGITSWAATEYGGKGYEKACRQMSLETAAACRGAIRAGYLPVVKDGHGDAMNIDHDLLPQEAELISGWACTPLSMLAGLDESFAGIIYVGYHAAAWTERQSGSSTPVRIICTTGSRSTTATLRNSPSIPALPISSACLRSCFPVTRVFAKKRSATIPAS